MGLLRKFYWPKVDRQTLRHLKEIKKIQEKWIDNPTKPTWNQLQDMHYVVCHRSRFTPWRRIKLALNGCDAFNYGPVLRGELKALCYKMAYGRSLESIAKEFVIRKR